MAAGCQTKLNYLASNLGTYRINVGASAGANTTVLATLANGTPGLLMDVFMLGNAANATVGSDVVIYDGAIAATNIVFTSAGKNISTASKIPVDAPITSGCLTINAQANCPPLWFSYVGTDTGGR